MHASCFWIATSCRCGRRRGTSSCQDGDPNLIFELRINIKTKDKCCRWRHLAPEALADFVRLVQRNARISNDVHDHVASGFNRGIDELELQRLGNRSRNLVGAQSRTKAQVRFPAVLERLLKVGKIQVDQ